MERPPPPAGRVQWPIYQAQDPNYQQAPSLGPQSALFHGSYQQPQQHGAPTQQGLGPYDHRPQPQNPCFQQSQTKGPHHPPAEVRAFQQHQSQLSSFQQSLPHGTFHQQLQLVSKDPRNSFQQQQTQGSHFQQLHAQEGPRQHQQPRGSTFQQTPPQGPVHSQSQKFTYHDQFQRPPYQHAPGPSYSGQQLQDPRFQHQYKETSFPMQQSSSSSFQSQPPKPTNPFQSTALFKEQPGITPFNALSGQPCLKQEPTRVTDLKQPEQLTFHQIQHHGGPYQQTNRSELPPPHSQDSSSLAPLFHQTFSSSESLGNGVPPFPTSGPLGKPPEHLHPSGSALQNIKMDSNPKGVVSHASFQGLDISEKPRYGAVLPPASLTTQSHVSSDPVHHQGADRTVVTGPSMQINRPLPRDGVMPRVGEPLVSQQVSTPRINYPPSMPPVRVQMHDSSPSLPLPIIQSQGNCPIPNPDRAHVPDQTPHTHSNIDPGKDRPTFTHLGRVPMQSHPEYPNQRGKLFTEGNNLPVHTSISFTYSNESQMHLKTTFPNLNNAQIEGNIQLPHSDKLQMLRPPPSTALDAAQMQTIPSLPVPQRIPVQNEGALAQGSHPIAYAERASIQRYSSLPQEKSVVQVSQQFTHLDRPPLPSSQQFPSSDSIPTKYGPPSITADLQGGQRDYQLPPYANKLQAQVDQPFPHLRMAPLQFDNRLPQPDRPEMQAEHPFPSSCMAPGQWHPNAEHFRDSGASPVCGGETQQLFSIIKGPNTGPISLLDAESIQRKQDELWISRFLANRRQTLQPQTKSAGSPSVAEARELLYGAQKLVWELRTVCQLLEENAENEDIWSEVYLQAVNIHKELQDKMKALNRPRYMEVVKKKLEKIRKKRRCIQSEKQETPVKKEEAARAAEREAKIDKWRMKCIQEVHEKKREREVKAAADSVLSEVLKKQGDTKRMISVLRALEKLRKLRKEAAARKGVSPPASADETFENHIKRLRLLIKERTGLYDAEERALRVMLEGEQEKERKIEREKKQQKERDKLLQQQHEINCILFGEPEELPPDHPLQPFRQYYLQAEHSLPLLIQIRDEWDRYLVPSDHPGGTCIPPGWVLPSLLSSDSWAAAVGQTD